MTKRITFFIRAIFLCHANLTNGRRQHRDGHARGTGRSSLLDTLQTKAHEAWRYVSSAAAGAGGPARSSRRRVLKSTRVSRSRKQRKHRSASQQQTLGPLEGQKHGNGIGKERNEHSQQEHQVQEQGEYGRRGTSHRVLAGRVRRRRSRMSGHPSSTQSQASGLRRRREKQHRRMKAHDQKNTVTTSAEVHLSAAPSDASSKLIRRDATSESGAPAGATGTSAAAALVNSTLLVKEPAKTPKAGSAKTALGYAEISSVRDFNKATTGYNYGGREVEGGFASLADGYMQESESSQQQIVDPRTQLFAIDAGAQNAAGAEDAYDTEDSASSQSGGKVENDETRQGGRVVRSLARPRAPRTERSLGEYLRDDDDDDAFYADEDEYDLLSDDDINLLDSAYLEDDEDSEDDVEASSEGDEATDEDEGAAEDSEGGEVLEFVDENIYREECIAAELVAAWKACGISDESLEHYKAGDNTSALVYEVTQGHLCNRICMLASEICDDLTGLAERRYTEVTCTSYWNRLQEDEIALTETNDASPGRWSGVALRSAMALLVVSVYSCLFSTSGDMHMNI